MNPFRRNLIAAGLSAFSTMPSWAQAGWPSRPLKLVVPYPPGASTDSLSRAFAQELSRELGQPVLVENRPGAATSIATLAVRNAPPDGYSMLFQTDGLYNAKIAVPQSAYEYADFDIISPLATTAYALLVPAARKVVSIEDLGAQAGKTGDITFAILGVGPNQYTVLGDALARHLGVRSRTVPYKGGIEGLTAVMNGEVDAFFATVSLAYAQRANPKVRAVALTSAGGRNRFFPAMRSLSEMGVEGGVFRSLFGVAIRSGAPATVQARLQEAVAGVVASEPMAQARASLSLEAFDGTLADYKTEVENNLRMYLNAGPVKP